MDQQMREGPSASSWMYLHSPLNSLYLIGTVCFFNFINYILWCIPAVWNHVSFLPKGKHSSPLSELGVPHYSEHRTQQRPPAGTLSAGWVSGLIPPVAWFTFVGSGSARGISIPNLPMPRRNCGCWATVTERPLHGSHWERGRPHWRAGFRKTMALGGKNPNYQEFKSEDIIATS